jgi:Putative zinc-finger
MTTNTSGPACREIRQLLGVYVVGAIDPAERALVDAHLTDCGACREELGGLAGLPALLGRVPVAEVEQMGRADDGVPDMLEPPAELLNSLLGRVSAQRRNRRWRSVLTLAAAVAIAAGGTAAVYNAAQPSGTHAPAAEVVRGANAELTSEVRYSATPWGGTAMDVAVKGLPPGVVCQFWIRTTTGGWAVSDSWTTPPGYGQHWYSVSSHVNAAQVNGFRITSGGKTLLVMSAS